MDKLTTTPVYKSETRTQGSCNKPRPSIGVASSKTVCFVLVQTKYWEFDWFWSEGRNNSRASAIKIISLITLNSQKSLIF